MKIYINRVLLFVCLSFCFSCSSSGQNVTNKKTIETTQMAQYSHKTVADFGAKLDGKTDDTDAIHAALDAVGYAFVPFTPEGVKVNKTIHIKNGQKLEGATRGVTFHSGVGAGEATFLIENIPFSGSAYLQNFRIIIENEGAIGVHILDSRQVNVLDFNILGKKKCETGILLEGRIKGSAWNVIDRYSITHTKGAAIKLVSTTNLPFVNRNYIGFGVAQSCGIGLWIKRGGTNTSLLNPQGCDVGVLIDENSHSNRIDSFMESCDVSIDIRGASRNNMINGNMSVKKMGARGSNTVWNLVKPKMRQLEGGQE